MDKICEALDLRAGDIFEYIKEDKEKNTQK
ncbi:helix-turn-helix domain-containing protein [Psychrobacter sp. APC 3281]